jgi:Protein of unknown function (DUF3617)
MKNLLLPLAALGACGVTAVLAADFTMRPGRWEVTFDIKLPASARENFPQSAAGEADKPLIDCLAEPLALDRLLIQGMGENCKVGNHRQEGNAIQFTANCEETVVDFRILRHSEDSYTAAGVTRARNPNERLTFASIAKRTGPSCSAKELAEYRARASDAE